MDTYDFVARQMNVAMQQTAGFKDYSKFLSDLQDGINDEVAAIYFYRKLMDLAPNESQRDSIKHAYDDEIKHFKMFTALYRRLTGREATVRVAETAFSGYKDGIHIAFYRELEAADLYRDMFLATGIPDIRDIFFEAMTDEMEHAQRFSFIFHQL